MVKMSRITAISLVLVLLAVMVAVSRRPYMVYARTSQSCDIQVSAKGTSHISLSSSTAISPGGAYDVTVSVDGVSEHFQHLQLGFEVTAGASTVSGITAPVIISRVMDTAQPEVKIDGTAQAVIHWTVPSVLFSGTYTFTPIVIGDGEQLSSTTAASATLESNTQTTGAYLVGSDPVRTALGSGLPVAADSSAQQMLQYSVQNSTVQPQSATVHWRLYAGHLDSQPLLKDDVTYSQSLPVGTTLTRPYFLDTNKVDQGYLEVEVITADTDTIQTLTLPGKSVAGLRLTALSQKSSGIAGVRSTNTTLCFTNGVVVPKNSIVTVILTDNAQTVLNKKTYSSGQSLDTQYSITDMALSNAWPLTVSVSVTASDQEVFRTTRNYQP